MVQSKDDYTEKNGLTSEQKQAELDKLAKGQLPEGANIAKEIVDICLITSNDIRLTLVANIQTIARLSQKSSNHRYTMNERWNKKWNV